MYFRAVFLFFSTQKRKRKVGVSIGGATYPKGRKCVSLAAAEFEAPSSLPGEKEERLAERDQNKMGDTKPLVYEGATFKKKIKDAFTLPIFSLCDFFSN